MVPHSVNLLLRKILQQYGKTVKGLIDIAFICSGPYAAADENSGFEMLVAVEINGSHFCQSYLTVSKSAPFKELEDLRGKGRRIASGDFRKAVSGASAQLRTVWQTESLDDGQDLVPFGL